MTLTYLIIGAVVVLLLLVLIVVLLGNKRKKEKTVSFNKEDKPKELTREEKSGNYTASGGFNFAPAKDKEPILNEGQELGKSAPIVGEAAAAAFPVAGSAKVNEPAKLENTEAKTVEDKSAEPEVVASELAEVPVLDDVDAPLDNDPEPEATVQAPAEDSAVVQENPVEAPIEEPAVEEVETHVVTPEPAADQVIDAEEDVIAEAEEAAEAAAVTADAVEKALEETPVPVTQPEPSPAPLDEIEPAAGRLGKLRGKLVKSNNFLGQSVLGMLTAGDLDEDAWEEIEDQLIMADLGTTTTVKVVESLREKIAERGVASEDEARAMLRETLIEVGKPELDRSIKAMPYEGKPAVVLVVGVNGTGKTTTTGKLARVLVSMGHKVLLGAADTFRAAAADQLETWGRRVGAETVRGAEGADPASVAFDAVAKGVETQADVVLIDTAGRLHTSVGLMDQLGKVKRVVEKKAKVDEVLLVLDATVGQNGLMQARTFRDVVDITGVVLTKLDGTAKGGIVFQVQEELGVPVKLVGLGEGADHLAPFEVESFVDALLA